MQGPKQLVLNNRQPIFTANFSFFCWQKILTSVVFNELTMEEKEMQENKTNGANEMTDYSINADENAAGTTHLSEPVAEESQAEKLQAELEEQKNKYVRLYAEFDNFRRRTAKEKIRVNANCR